TFHSLNRTRDFAFERPDAGHLLHERREPDRAQVVEKLIARVGTAWQPFFGQQHPSLCCLAAPDENLCPLGVDVEIDARLAKRCSNTANVLRTEPTVERFELRPAHVEANRCDRAQCRRANNSKRHEAPVAQSTNVLPQSLDVFSPDHSNRLMK